MKQWVKCSVGMLRFSTAHLTIALMRRAIMRIKVQRRWLRMKMGCLP